MLSLKGWLFIFCFHHHFYPFYNHSLCGHRQLLDNLDNTSWALQDTFEILGNPNDLTLQFTYDLGASKSKIVLRWLHSSMAMANQYRTFDRQIQIQIHQLGKAGQGATSEVPRWLASSTPTYMLVPVWSPTCACANVAQSHPNIHQKYELMI